MNLKIFRTSFDLSHQIKKCWGALELLPRLPKGDLLTRCLSNMTVNEMAGDLKLKSNNEAINEFVLDCREYLEHLKGLRTTLK